MARYRKVDPRIWNDEKFRELSDSGKLAFFFVLTHPHMTSLGAMRHSIPGLAAEMGWDVEAFRKAFGEATAKGLIKVDEKASCIVLPKFIKYNGPESPNVLKAWGDALDLIPECSTKNELIQSVKDFSKGLSQAFQQALPKAFSKPMPNQEQEQKQKQEQGEKGEKPPRAKPQTDSNITMKTFLDSCKEDDEKAIPEDDAVFKYSEEAKLPGDFVWLAWREFVARHIDRDKKYKGKRGWRQAFGNCVRGNWYELWAVGEDGYFLTKQGKQAQIAHKEAA